MEIFGRKVEIVVEDIDISDLRVSFDIVRSLRRTPNKAEIKIYNLSDTTRRLIESAHNPRVRVKAGYIDGVSSIFFGALKEVRTQVEGPNVVTSLSGIDGGRSTQTGRTNRAHAPGTNITDVVRGLASDMQTGIGNAIEAFRNQGAEGAFSTFFEGTAVHGSAAHELDGLVRSRNLEWSIQDESLQIVPRGRALQGEALVISASSGMLGIPSISKSRVVTFEMALIPDMFPGRRIQMDSRFISGLFRVEKCEYVGDSGGKDWKIKVEAKDEARLVRTRAPAGESAQEEDGEE